MGFATKITGNRALLRPAFAGFVLHIAQVMPQAKRAMRYAFIMKQPPINGDVIAGALARQCVRGRVIIHETGAAAFSGVHRRLLLTPGDKIQNGLQMEKPGAFDLPRFPDGYGAEMAFARAFVQFSAAKSRPMVNPLFG